MRKIDVSRKLRSKYKRVYNLLVERYGEPRWQRGLGPEDELVCTILSQATSDLNRDKGFNGLKERYPDWVAVMNAPTADVRDAIWSAGLANQKAPRIQNALRYVYEERGEIDLEWLGDIPVDEARAWLTNIKGIGLKTASIIMLFTFGKEAFPVDTHVHRITKRLGLIGPKVSATKAHGILEAIAPPEQYYPLHMNLIHHGRALCTARNPKCEVCPLQKECDHYRNLRHTTNP